MPTECVLDRNALVMGLLGVYSSFLKHAVRQSERYGVPAHELLNRAGQRKLIGGQGSAHRHRPGDQAGAEQRPPPAELFRATGFPACPARMASATRR